MIAYAALDLRAGRVVQLVGGDPADERVSLPDPAAVARAWLDCGFAALHVVDLDGALGVGDNGPSIARVLACSAGALVQVGGGARTSERVAWLLDAGAARVVVGTRAVRDRKWLEEIAARWPRRIVVAADVRGDEVVLSGWTESAGRNVDALLADLDALPLAAVLVTDVAREGRMTGVDAAAFRRLAAASRHPLLASGGIAGVSDLAALEDAGAAGAVLGMSLYTGALDARAIARSYAS